MRTILHQRLAWIPALVMIWLCSTSAFGQDVPDAAAKSLQEARMLLKQEIRETADGGLPDLALLRRIEYLLKEPCMALSRKGQHVPAGECLMDLAEAQQRLKEWESALSSTQQAFQAAKDADDRRLQASALLGQAEVQRRGFQDLDRSLAILGKAWALASGLSDSRLEFAIQLAQCRTQAERGVLDAAESACRSASETATREGQSGWLLDVYEARIGIYVVRQERCAGETHWRECSDLLGEFLDMYRQYAHLAGQLGYQKLGRSLQAHITAIQEQKQIVDGLVEQLNSQERNLKELGVEQLFHPKNFSHVSATRVFNTTSTGELSFILEIRRAAERLLNAKGSLKRFLDAEVLLRSGRSEEALAQLLKGMELLDSRRRPLKKDADLFQITVPLLLAHDRKEKAFQLMEKAKTRRVADILDTVDLRFRNAKYKEMREMELETRLTISRTHAAIESLENLVSAAERSSKAPDGRKMQQMKEGIDALSKKVELLEGEYSTLSSHIRRLAPEIVAIADPSPISLPALQEGLPAGLEVVEYLVLDTAVLVWHIRKDDVQVRSVFLPRGELVRKIESLHASLRNPDGPFDLETARVLYLFLIRCLGDSMRGRRLLIIPDQEMFLLPFEVLFDQDTGRHLGESAQISYASTATDWASQSPAKVRGASMAVAYKGQADSAQEAMAVSRELGTLEKDIWNRKALTNERFKALCQYYELIHLAVPGRIGEGITDSFLDLEAEETEGSVLPIGDIFGLDLSGAELVALTRSEFQSASTRCVDAFLGMIRGFSYAGANSVLLTRWSLPADARLLWLKTFYAEAKSRPLAEASQIALRTVRLQERFHHPHYWAGWALFGH